MIWRRYIVSSRSLNFFLQYPFLDPDHNYSAAADFHDNELAHGDHSAPDDDCYGSELEHTADYDGDDGDYDDDCDEDADFAQGSHEEQVQDYESEHETASEEAEGRYASHRKGEEAVVAVVE